MSRCVRCGVRKGKRACPALAGPICSVCCGVHRRVDIACPESCAYLPHATREALVSVASRLGRFADLRLEWQEPAVREWLGPDASSESWE